MPLQQKSKLGTNVMTEIEGKFLLLAAGDQSDRWSTFNPAFSIQLAFWSFRAKLAKSWTWTNGKWLSPSKRWILRRRLFSCCDLSQIMMAFSRVEVLHGPSLRRAELRRFKCTDPRRYTSFCAMKPGRHRPGGHETILSRFVKLANRAHFIRLHSTSFDLCHMTLAY